MSCRGVMVSLVVILLAKETLLVHARDSITRDQPLQDGQTLISSDDNFELGFFSPGRSTNRYVGVWYYNFSKSDVLWVANRENPVPNHSGSFTISSSNNLVVVDGENNVVWSSNVSMASNQSATAQLLTSGNLMLKSAFSDVPAWQSFDHPTDTYMPGMKFGLDMVTGVNQVITSWRSDDDPAPGNYSMGIDPLMSTQIFVWEGHKPRWRSGRWNGQVFTGIEKWTPTYTYGFRLSNFQEEKKMYFYYNNLNSSIRYVLTKDGVEEKLERKEDTKVWTRIWAEPVIDCQVYNHCGDNAKCTDGATPFCECLKGFVPVNGEEWARGKWSAGCVRRTALQCERNGSVGGEEDGFWKMQNVKLPDLSTWDTNIYLNDSTCRMTCLRSCSCSSYVYVDGVGCLTWAKQMVDVQVFSTNGEDFYLRLAASELEEKKKFDAVVVVVVVLSVLVFVGCALLFWRCKSNLRGFMRRWRRRKVVLVDRSEKGEGIIHFKNEGEDGKWQELPLLSFDSIATSTENFSNLNLLGEGGFGPVYKGILPGGQEVAVKRLSKISGQGLEEFKNEVILIAKLQHRNLVRLLGCCMQEEERILVYEHMPNKSLDAFIFGYDSRKKQLLDWGKRWRIIEGIARGLLYLHRDSRLRVIHRDLKASNVLLDEEMNPKISDFGLARIFGSDEKETNTKRVAGTYGYMSPEYAMNGLFSVKSDVYSFGVLLLEIISGERNSTFCHIDLSLDLLSYAWKLWNEGNVMEFVEPCIRASCSPEDALRCINVGLLCVQDHANDRPTMATVVFMLECGISTHPLPRKPVLAAGRKLDETDSSSPDLKVVTGYRSITMLSAR